MTDGIGGLDEELSEIKVELGEGVDTIEDIEVEIMVGKTVGRELDPVPTLLLPITTAEEATSLVMDELEDELLGCKLDIEVDKGNGDVAVEDPKLNMEESVSNNE